jgi:hypothetical protein
MSVGAEPGVGTYQAHTLRTLELADFLLIAECVLANSRQEGGRGVEPSV